MKRFISMLLALAIIVFATGGMAFAASNPNGIGQPSQSCQAEPAGPSGLESTTNGFATRAVNVYAGAPGTKSSAVNPKAVSQYDVACYQVSQD